MTCRGCVVDVVFQVVRWMPGMGRSTRFLQCLFCTHYPQPICKLSTIRKEQRRVRVFPARDCVCLGFVTRTWSCYSSEQLNSITSPQLHLCLTLFKLRLYTPSLSDCLFILVVFNLEYVTLSHKVSSSLGFVLLIVFFLC